MRDEYREWVADALLDRDDRDEWERQRNADLGLDAPRPTHDEMVEHWAVERRAIEKAAAEAWDSERPDWRIGAQRRQVELEAERGAA